MKKILCYVFLILFVIGTFLLSWNAPIANAAEVYPFNGVLVADSLVVHSTSSGNNPITELAYGTKVIVTQKENNRYKITYDTDKTGYVASSYVINVDANILTTDVDGIETYNDYCNSLIAKGFVKSYCPYLYYLHSKYPNWTFTADKINNTLDKVASEEEGKVVLQTANSNYWYNTKPIEGDYYYVKGNVISSFMDPRNSLFEGRIFQFLDLEESKDIYNDVALKKVSGTSGNLINYISEYKDAASNNGINALHIMARSKQEGANTVTYSSVTGLYTTSTGRTSVQGYSLDGYYNFYNIQAFADGTYSFTVQRGLAYAAGFLSDESCISQDSSGLAYYDEDLCGVLSYQRPWNTPAKAISGGAEFIASSYVKKGQDTLYYQKFNVASYSQYNKYTHQYMTNLYAPASESNTMYSAYNAGSLLNSSFNFVIPVYDDMPDDGYQAVLKNGDSSLSSITINDKNFSEFDSVVVEYNYNLVMSDDVFKIGAKTTQSTSSVEGTGDYTFVDNKAIVKLVVTAEDGSSTTYVINVTKIVPEEVVSVTDIVTKMGVKVSNDIMYGISPDTAVTTLVNTVSKNKGEASVTDSKGKVKTSGSYVTGDKITIKGTSESKTYTIAVRGDVNGDGLVKINDLILIQSHILERAELTGVKYYAADVSYDGNIKINDLVLVQSHILEKSSL